jgi:hypothetical protein
MQRDIQQQGADDPTLWHAGVGGMQYLILHVSGFEPLLDQLPSREVANSLHLSGLCPILLKAPSTSASTTYGRVVFGRAMRNRLSIAS